MTAVQRLEAHSALDVTIIIISWNPPSFCFPAAFGMDAFSPREIRVVVYQSDSRPHGGMDAGRDIHANSLSAGQISLSRLCYWLSCPACGYKLEAAIFSGVN
jgi:hypothetical protein